jgi:hypothetical protein
MPHALLRLNQLYVTMEPNSAPSPRPLEFDTKVPMFANAHHDQGLGVNFGGPLLLQVCSAAPYRYEDYFRSKSVPIGIERGLFLDIIYI